MTTSYSNTPSEGQTGKASTYYVHDPLFTNLSFAWHKAGVEQAAANGEIEHVYYADYQMLQVLGIFGKFTTRVQGE